MGGQGGVYCAYEDGSFPDEEFKSSEEHGWVHGRDPIHTTLGEVIESDGSQIPGPLDVPPEPE